MRVIVYATRKTTHRWIQALGRFGIALEVLPSPSCPGDSASDVSEPVDAALFELESLPRGRRGEAIARLQQRGVCVVGVAGADALCPWKDYSEEELDGVVPANSSAGELACALWSAHRQSELRRVLAQRIDELELTLEHRKRIEHAKSVLAEMMNITEADALRHLRREARNRRRPMHEMAHVVIEARELFRVPNGRDQRETDPQTATATLGA